jgi:hypothetical protein
MIPGPVSLVVFFMCIVAGTAGLFGAKSKSLGVGVVVWLVATGLAGWFGLVRDFQRLPPPLFVLLFVAVLLTVTTALSRVGSRLVAEAGIAWLVGVQAFRIAVEVFLDWGHRVNLVPVQMTLEGRNWDIVTGVSAAAVAPLSQPAREQFYRLFSLYLATNIPGAASSIRPLTGVPLASAGTNRLAPRAHSHPGSRRA